MTALKAIEADKGIPIDTVIAMALENLQRYLDRQPLKYRVDRQSGYRISNNGE